MTVEYINIEVTMLKNIPNLFQNGRGLCSHITGLLPQVWFLMFSYGTLIMEVVPTIFKGVNV